MMKMKMRTRMKAWPKMIATKKMMSIKRLYKNFRKSRRRWTLKITRRRLSKKMMMI
jgi:hypothetical protein